MEGKESEKVKKEKKREREEGEKGGGSFYITEEAKSKKIGANKLVLPRI